MSKNGNYRKKWQKIHHFRYNLCLLVRVPVHQVYRNLAFDSLNGIGFLQSVRLPSASLVLVGKWSLAEVLTTLLNDCCPSQWVFHCALLTIGLAYDAP
jgi:hypothetical protein